MPVHHKLASNLQLSYCPYVATSFPHHMHSRQLEANAQINCWSDHQVPGDALFGCTNNYIRLNPQE